jgi:hypothetical protein
VAADLLRDPAGRTPREALAAWPAEEPALPKRILLRRLAELMDSGWQIRAGREDRFDPYRNRVA